MQPLFARLKEFIKSVDSLFNPGIQAQDAVIERVVEQLGKNHEKRCGEFLGYMNLFDDVR